MYGLRYLIVQLVQVIGFGLPYPLLHHLGDLVHQVEAAVAFLHGDLAGVAELLDHRLTHFPQGKLKLMTDKVEHREIFFTRL